MLKIVMIMLCGIGTGYLLRNKKMSFIGRIITALIWILLFLLGIEVGANPRIINGLQTLGLEAVILTLGGSAGDRKSTRLNSSHSAKSRMPSSA